MYSDSDESHDVAGDSSDGDFEHEDEMVEVEETDTQIGHPVPQPAMVESAASVLTDILDGKVEIKGSGTESPMDWDSGSEKLYWEKVKNIEGKAFRVKSLTVFEAYTGDQAANQSFESGDMVILKIPHTGRENVYHENLKRHLTAAAKKVIFEKEGIDAEDLIPDEPCHETAVAMKQPPLMSDLNNTHLPALSTMMDHRLPPFTPLSSTELAVVEKLHKDCISTEPANPALKKKVENNFFWFLTSRSIPFERIKYYKISADLRSHQKSTPEEQIYIFRFSNPLPVRQSIDAFISHFYPWFYLGVDGSQAGDVVVSVQSALRHVRDSCHNKGKIGTGKKRKRLFDEAENEVALLQETEQQQLRELDLGTRREEELGYDVEPYQSQHTDRGKRATTVDHMLEFEEEIDSRLNKRKTLGRSVAIGSWKRKQHSRVVVEPLGSPGGSSVNTYSSEADHNHEPVEGERRDVNVSEHDTIEEGMREDEESLDTQEVAPAIRPSANNHDYVEVEGERRDEGVSEDDTIEEGMREEEESLHSQEDPPAKDTLAPSANKNPNYTHVVMGQYGFQPLNKCQGQGAVPDPSCVNSKGRETHVITGQYGFQPLLSDEIQSHIYYQPVFHYGFYPVIEEQKKELEGWERLLAELYPGVPAKVADQRLGDAIQSQRTGYLKTPRREQKAKKSIKSEDGKRVRRSFQDQAKMSHKDGVGVGGGGNSKMEMEVSVHDRRHHLRSNKRRSEGDIPHSYEGEDFEQELKRIWF